MRREDSWWWANGYTKEWFKALSEDERRAWLNALTTDEFEEWTRDWRVHARDKQLAPEGDWNIWIIKAGRGFGKTRTAVEFCNDEIWNNGVRRVAVVGQSEDDISKVMISGVSGFLQTAPPWRKPRWLSSKDGGTLIWPCDAVGYVHSAMTPGSLRGPEYELAWFDEPMSESIPAEKREETMANLEFGLRLGDNPRMVITTTPKPHRFLRELLDQAKDPTNGIVVTEGSTYENEENLAAKFTRKIRQKFEGTARGRQEVYGEMLGDEDGAIWTADRLDASRIRVPGLVGDRAEREVIHDAFVKKFLATCDEVVVGVDPNMKAGKGSHAAGIIVAASRNDHRYIVKDRSVVGQSPAKWAKEVVRACEDFGATTVIAEVNQGGDLVKEVVLAAADKAGVDVNVIKVHAQKGKVRRAEPYGAAYERKVVHQVGDCGRKDDPGEFYLLESQMCAIHENYDPTGEDFDRADAACWALKYLRTADLADSSAEAGLTLHTFDDFVPGGAYQ